MYLCHDFFHMVLVLVEHVHVWTISCSGKMFCTFIFSSLYWIMCTTMLMFVKYFFHPLLLVLFGKSHSTWYLYRPSKMIQPNAIRNFPYPSTTWWYILVYVNIRHFYCSVVCLHPNTFVLTPIIQ